MLPGQNLLVKRAVLVARQNAIAGLLGQGRQQLRGGLIARRKLRLPRCPKLLQLQPPQQFLGFQTDFGVGVVRGPFQFSTGLESKLVERVGCLLTFGVIVGAELLDEPGDANLARGLLAADASGSERGQQGGGKRRTGRRVKR